MPAARRIAWTIWRHLREPSLHVAAGRMHATLARAQSLGPEGFRDLQLELLRRFLFWCRQHVPYYRRVLSSAGVEPGPGFGWDDFRRIPLLTRDLVRRHARDLVSRDPGVRDRAENRTGGSTGTPLSFFQDRTYRVHGMACDRFFRQTWGLHPYGWTAYVWGCDRDITAQSLRERFWNWFSGEIYLDAFRLDAGRLAEFLRRLDHHPPEAIIGYVSSLRWFASHLPPGRRWPSLRVVRTSAETLDAETRELLERTFHCPVADFYGSREVNNVAWECPEAHGMHVFSPWRIVELVGPPLDPEGSRRVVVTDLANRAMPFVRYANGDLALPGPDQCSCGRGSPLIGSIRGRTSDLLLGRDGKWIHGEFFTHLFYGFPGLQRFRLHQDAERGLHLLLQGDPGAAQDALPRVLREIEAACGVRPRVEWKERLDPSPSGKYRFTTSELADRAFDSSRRDGRSGA